jgi:MFS family permease
MWRFGDAIRLAVGLRFLTRSQGKPMLRLDLMRTAFGPFLVAYLLFYTFQYLPLPILPLFYVHELNLTDGAISLGSALFHAVMMMFSLRISRWSTRYGHYRLLVIGAISFCLYPLVIGLARDATLFWAASLLGGGAWAITSAGLINRLMEKVPQDSRPAYMALHNLALNLGILAGSLAGPVLSHWIGLREAVLAAAGLRLLAGIFLAIWG